VRRSHAKYTVTISGREWMETIGIDWEQLGEERRELATQCLDWTEQRSHIGGALGAILFRLLKLEWIAQSPIPRLVRITHEGEAEFEKQLGLVIPRRWRG
jgi:hypothetical protein